MNFPQERNNVIVLGKDFGIDIIKYFEKAFASEYSDEVKKDPGKVADLRKYIIDTMSKYNISASETLDKIEKNNLEKLCLGIDVANEKKCNELQEKLKSYDALEKNKTAFYEKIKNRIEEIWTQEDRLVFDNVYTSTNIMDAKEVGDALAFIQKKGRTSDSQKYIDALNACNEGNIKSAQKFLSTGYKIKKIYAIIFLINGLVSIFAYWPFGLVCLVLSILLFILNGKIKKNWKLITIDGKHFHNKVFTDKQQIVYRSYIEKHNQTDTSGT